MIRLVEPGFKTALLIGDTDHDAEVAQALEVSAALVAGAICVGSPFGLVASEVQVGRYTSIRVAPTEAQANLFPAEKAGKMPAARQA